MTAALRRAGPFLFAVSWILRLGLVFSTGSFREPVKPDEMVLVARSLAAGQGFANPYGCVTGPTAHLAPVYPFLLSLLFRVFPPGAARELAAYALAVSLASLAYALLPWLAVRLRLDRRVGIAAGLLGALMPLYFWVEVVSEWEAPLIALLLVTGLGLFAGVMARTTTGGAMRGGAVWGFAILTAPAMMPVFAVLGAVLLRRDRRAAALLCLSAAVVIAPWSVRNYAVFHEPILVRGNAGLQLHLSFNDRARVTFDEGALSGAFADHPYTTAAVCAEFARRGEVAMNRTDERKAFEWIRANPGRAAQLVAGHFEAFWAMRVPSRAKTVAGGILTLLALAGLAVCLRFHPFAGRLAGIVFLAFPLVYYVNFFDARYRYPLHPLVLLLACGCVGRIRERVMR